MTPSIKKKHYLLEDEFLNSRREIAGSKGKNFNRLKRGQLSRRKERIAEAEVHYFAETRAASERKLGTNDAPPKDIIKTRRNYGKALPSRGIHN